MTKRTDKPEQATLAHNACDDELMIIGRNWIRFVRMSDLESFIRDEVFENCLREGSDTVLPDWLQRAVEYGQGEALEEIEAEQRHRQETEAYFRSKR